MTLGAHELRRFSGVRRGYGFDAHSGFEAWMQIAFELAEFELANWGRRRATTPAHGKGNHRGPRLRSRRRRWSDHPGQGPERDCRVALHLDRRWQPPRDGPGRAQTREPRSRRRIARRGPQ